MSYLCLGYSYLAETDAWHYGGIPRWNATVDVDVSMSRFAGSPINHYLASYCSSF